MHIHFPQGSYVVFVYVDIVKALQTRITFPCIVRYMHFNPFYAPYICAYHLSWYMHCNIYQNLHTWNIIVADAKFTCNKPTIVCTSILLKQSMTINIYTQLVKHLIINELYLLWCKLYEYTSTVGFARNTSILRTLRSKKSKLLLLRICLPQTYYTFNLNVP